MDKIKLVDFLTEKIFEESSDANSYISMAANCTDSMVKSTLSKISEDELQHQRSLVKLLADLAKESGESN